MSGVIIGLVAALTGGLLGYVIRHVLGKLNAETVESKAKRLFDDAKREAQTTLKEAKISAKAEMLKAREDFEKSTESRKKELAQMEDRVAQRETNLDRKVTMLDRKEQTLEGKYAEMEERSRKLEREDQLLDEERQRVKESLQRVAAMTRDEARGVLLEKLETELRGEVGALIRKSQEKAREMSEREARKIITQAIQRYAAPHASDVVTTSVALPGDDMKGRIIGREGRNIRSLESLTGVSILVDDTPEAVVISGFDPVRREIARQALEQLIVDGRIHPARIEELVEKAEAQVEESIRAAGEDALFELGLQGVDPECVRTLGRLKFRTSYAQNVLRHSIEVAQLMGMMAGELGMDPQIAKRTGLFHDIGKALDHEIEGGHATIGADLLKRCGEAPEVVNAVAAHHEDVEAETAYAALCSAADAISSSRLGARSETTGLYIKRLEKLEAIANSFEGVVKSYAIQAGREIRVMVEPDTIDDSGAMVMARDMCRRIETDLKYPGQIRVTVIRERRCVDYAK